MKRLFLFSTALASLFAIACVHGAEDAVNFHDLAKSLNSTMRSQHYHPAELDTEAFRQVENTVVKLGDTAKSADEFMTGFNNLWRPGLFSHVRLMHSQPAAAPVLRSDTPKVDDGAVTLAWEGSTAILTVNSMSDTSEKIDAAYIEITAKGAKKLIIDLRRNGGGAFGVLPLVGHLISETVDAGVFVTSQWYKTHDAPPRAADFKSATPCQCSDEAFLADMKKRALTSYRINPMPPRFVGPVFVLTSGVSISAAEIAADALKATGRATLIGEKTPGILLQPERFDIGGGFALRWPIGDYFSTSNGRIEGIGVKPDIAASASEAMDIALGL